MHIMANMETPEITKTPRKSKITQRLGAVILTLGLSGMGALAHNVMNEADKTPVVAAAKPATPKPTELSQTAPSTTTPEVITTTEVEPVSSPETTIAKPARTTTSRRPASSTTEAPKQIEGKVSAEQLQQQRKAFVLIGRREKGSQTDFAALCGGAIGNMSGNVMVSSSAHCTDLKELYPSGGDGAANITSKSRFEYAILSPDNHSVIGEVDQLGVTLNHGDDLALMTVKSARQEFLEKAKSALPYGKTPQPVKGQEVGVIGFPNAAQTREGVGTLLGIVERYENNGTISKHFVVGIKQEADSPFGPGASGSPATGANGDTLPGMIDSIDRNDPTDDAQYQSITNYTGANAEEFAHIGYYPALTAEKYAAVRSVI
jgi:hypothetical protein